MGVSIVNGLGRNRTVKFGDATVASKRDSSAAQADSFADERGERRRLASVLPAAGRRTDVECVGHSSSVAAGEIDAIEKFAAVEPALQ